jgi:hypothetical protein
LLRFQYPAGNVGARQLATPPVLKSGVFSEQAVVKELAASFKSNVVTLS